MKYTGKILEAYNVRINALADDSGQVYIAYDSYLYRMLDDCSLQKMLEFPRRKEVKFVQDGLWLCDYPSYRNPREGSEFVDVFELGNLHPSISECLSHNKIPIIDAKIFATGSKDDGEYLCGYDLETNLRKEIQGDYVFLVSDGRYIFAKSLSPKALACFDLDLNQVWDYPFSGYGSKASQYPQFDGDLVFIAPTTTVYAIEKKTGALKWQYEFQFPPGSFTVGNGRVYCAHAGQMVVLDAQTGEILVQEDTGLVAFDPREKHFQATTDISLTPIGDDKLYVGSNYDRVIKIFSADGKNCLQTIDLNETGYPWGAFSQPLVLGDKIFQKLGSDRSEYGSGVLMLQAVDDDSGEGIEIYARPPVSIYAVPSLLETHCYQIYVESSELDLVDRYAGIALVELLYETARSPSLDGIKQGAFDNLHDGTIELIIDPEAQAKDVDAVMQSMIDDVMGFVELRRIITAKGNQPISISYRCLKQGDWVRDGENLDLDKARKEGKPLN